jgi:hypothetical protein
MHIFHVDWHIYHLMRKEGTYVPIIIHILLHCTLTTCTQIILFVCQKHVVHESNVHELEALVNILHSELAQHVNQFPLKPILTHKSRIVCPFRPSFSAVFQSLSNVHQVPREIFETFNAAVDTVAGSWERHTHSYG